MMIWLLSLSAFVLMPTEAQVTSAKRNPLPIYNKAGAQLGTLSKADLPPLPTPIVALSDFGDLGINAQGRIVYVRPVSVVHTMPVCGGRETVRRESGTLGAASTPGGVRRGGAGDDGECLPQ